MPTSSRRQTPVPTSSRRHTPMPTSSRCHTPVPTSSWRHTLLHDHTMEEASQTIDKMCLDTAYDIGSMAHDDASLSHTFAHAHPSQSPSMRSCGTCPPTSPSTSSLPTTRTSPPLTTGTAPAVVHGRDDMRFMPTPGQPTPGAVPSKDMHTEFIQTQIPTPHQILHTLRIGREGRNRHGHILLIVDWTWYYSLYTSNYIYISL